MAEYDDHIVGGEAMRQALEKTRDTIAGFVSVADESTADELWNDYEFMDKD